MNRSFQGFETNQVEEAYSNPQVLVVDDDTIVLEVAKLNLQEQGFVVSCVESGQKALEQFESLRPDIVLLDLEMPGMDGFETCRRIKKLSVADHIPIVVMTSRDDTNSIERAFEARVTDFVTKPVNWVILAQRLRYICRASLTMKNSKRHEARLLDAQRMANLGYWDWEMSEGKLYLSEKAADILGLTVRVVDQPAVIDLETSDHLKFVHDEDKNFVRENLTTKILKGEPFLLEYCIETPAGEARYIRNIGQVEVLDSGERSSRYIGTLLDITEQRNNEATIRKMAFYDSVTGLLNRSAFEEELELLVKLHERQKKQLAVIYLDLDNFKQVNDSLGHHVGDDLLKQFANRLKSIVRASDVSSRDEGLHLAARLGGDEFTLLLTDLKTRGGAVIVAERIQSALESPFFLDVKGGEEITRHEIYVRASFGIALYPEDGSNAETLLKNADTAMYAAKRQGSGSYRFYVDEMNKKTLDRIRMESALRGLVERSELFLEYLPVIDLQSGKGVALEALVRWNNPELGLIEPDVFIPLAENSGQIEAINTWVLETVCRQLKQWRDENLPLFQVAINLSSVQFRGNRFVARVREILDKNGLEPESLEFELAESGVMSGLKSNIDVLKTLQRMGSRVSIDDFGKGYSSLSKLQQLPINGLKIDQGFVQNLGKDSSSEALVNAIISMGKGLGFTLTAEGVEDSAQLDFLLQKGCDFGQGYLFSRPLKIDKVREFFQQLDYSDLGLPGTSS